ncbi:MAG: hypothetical protein JWL77_1755 [Chthonomonadaceae bacterium]|nr:hypothetical protein [Chthonomonadaceae bacterium]
MVMSTAELEVLSPAATPSGAGAVAATAGPSEAAVAARNPPISPFRTAESFDAYCSQVQGRLAEYAEKRVHFLQAAYDRLTRLLQAARDVEDTALYNELLMHRVAVRELLESLQSPVQSSVSASSMTSASMPMSTPVSPPPGRPTPPPPRAPRVVEENAPTTTSPTTEAVVASPSERPAAIVVPRVSRRPSRPLVDIEADAIRLRAEVRDWNNLYPLTVRKELNLPNCLRLRAMACRQRKLEEEAGEIEVPQVTELMEDIIDLMDAANDMAYTAALDDELDPRPHAGQWAEMAERYEEMARAQEAFDWWQRHKSFLKVPDIQGLAEAVAAMQQRFNRLLFRIGATDPFQQAMFDDLRTWAREDQCYLYSLRPKVPMQELIERAATLEASWDRARQPVIEEERRQQVVENVITLVSEPEFGSEPERDERRLHAALAECKNMRIPASDRRLRDALLPWGAFLEDDERFKELLREINLEWERRQEAGRPEEIEDETDSDIDAVQKELAAVREVTRGKRLLILGGTCREENRRKLEAALELRELVWPSTKPSDPLARFDTDIRHSDIVALLTRFSRKEWKNAQDICAREGKKFVHLTTGYGVSQVVRHFYNQIAPEGAAHAQ